MADTALLTGRVLGPDGEALSAASLRIVMAGADADTLTREVIAPGGDRVIELESDGAIPDGTEIWRNTAGLRGTWYRCYLTHSDAAGLVQTRHLCSFQIGEAESYDIGDLLDQTPPEPLGAGWWSTLTQGQYNAAIDAVAEAEGHAAVSRQAAGEATAGIVALALSAAAGAAATSPGELFAVGVDAAGDDPARLDLYINDAGTARLLPIDYRPNAPMEPLQPPPPAALTIEARAQWRGTVKLRQVLGHGYRPTDNAAALINAATPYLTGSGLALQDTEGLTLRITSKLFLRSGLRMEGVPGKTRIERAWSTTGINNFSLMHEDMSVDLEQVHLKALIIAKASAGDHGGGIRAYLKNSSIEDVLIESYTRGQALFLGGQDLRVFNFWAYSPEDQTGNGLFRIFGGRNIMIGRSGGECFDDGCMGLPAAATGGPRDNEPLINLTFWGMFVVSRGGKSCIIAVGTNTTGDGNDTYQGRIVNPRFMLIRGRSKNRPLVVGCNTSTPTERMVDQVLFDDVQIEMFETSGNSAAVQLNSQDDRAIGRVTARNVTITGPRASNGTTAAVPVNYGVDVNARGIELVLDNLNINALAHAIRARQPFTRIEHRGGEVWSTTGTYQTDPDGGGDPTGEGRTPIFLTSAVGADSVYEFHGHPIIKEVATDKQGLYAAAGRIVAPRVEVRKATGATGTKAIVTGNSATAEIGVITGTTDSPYLNGSGSVSRQPAMRSTGAATPVSGVLTITATETEVDTEGAAATSNIHTIVVDPAIPAGTLISISPVADGRDPILQHLTSGGNITTPGGTDVRLNYGTSRAIIYWSGTRAEIISKHNPA